MIKVAQIGVTHDHATDIMRTLRKFPELFQIVGVYADSEDVKNNETYKGLDFLSVDEILAIPDLDAVTIETEEFTLLEMAEKCVNRGLHIHMDKPAGIDLLKWKNILDIAKEKNLVVSMGYMYRYNPAVLKLFEEIQAGKFGRIYSVEAHMNCEHTKEKRQWMKKFPGGMMYYLGCHLADLIYKLQGEPDSVIPLNLSTKIDGVDSEDFGMAVLKYENGVSFLKACDTEINGFMRRQIVVNGDKARAVIEPIEYYGRLENGEIDVESQYTDMTLSYKEESVDWHGTGIKNTYGPIGRYDTMMKAFYEYVKGKPNPYTYDYEYNVQKLILKTCNYKGE